MLIETGPIFLKELFSYFTALNLQDPIIVLNGNELSRDLIAPLDELFENYALTDPGSKFSNMSCLWKICANVSKIKGTNSSFSDKKKEQKSNAYWTIFIYIVPS